MEHTSLQNTENPSKTIKAIETKSNTKRPQKQQWFTLLYDSSGSRYYMTAYDIDIVNHRLTLYKYRPDVNKTLNMSPPLHDESDAHYQHSNSSPNIVC